MIRDRDRDRVSLLLGLLILTLLLLSYLICILEVMSSIEETSIEVLTTLLLTRTLNLEP